MNDIKFGEFKYTTYYIFIIGIINLMLTISNLFINVVLSVSIVIYLKDF